MVDRVTIDLVQVTWAHALKTAPNAGLVFYDQLFAADPTLRQLFKGSIDEQSLKLIGMLSMAIGKLDNLAGLQLVLAELGKRHVGYGVTPQHYATVGAALIGTLAIALGDAFTTEVKTAWLTVYQTLSDTMIAGAATCIA